MSCNHKFRIDYDPPISWEVFTVHRARKEFLCEKCNTPCQSIGQFNHVEQQEQDQVPDLEPPIPIQKMESMDEWRILVKEKYDKLGDKLLKTIYRPYGLLSNSFYLSGQL